MPDLASARKTRTHCVTYDDYGNIVDRCPLLRVHDSHYYYCRALGNQTKEDFHAYNGGMKQIHSITLEVLPGCPFAEKPEVTDEEVQAAIDRGDIPARGGDFALGWIVGGIAERQRNERAENGT